MNRADSAGEGTASGRASTRSGRGAPRPRTENPEALLRPLPTRGQKTPSASDTTAGLPAGGGNRVQVLYDALLPRLQTWMEESRAEELPQVVQICLYRTVPRLVAEHADTALQALLDEKLDHLGREEVVAALAVEEDESPTALALKGAISSAVAIRLATTFTTETGGAVPPPAPRNEPVPDSIFNIADPIGAVPGIERMDPHPEGRAIYLPIVHGATGRTTENVLPILAGTGDPRGTDNRLGLHETENQDPYRLSRRRAPGTHRTEAEYTRYSEAEDPRLRTDEDREERRW